MSNFVTNHVPVHALYNAFRYYGTDKIRKFIYRFEEQVTLCFTVISDGYGSFIPYEATQNTVLLSGFRISPGYLKSTE